MTTNPDKKVKCWSCDGSGISSLAQFNTAGINIPCERCGASGECLEIMREWENTGKAYRAERQLNNSTLREWAEKLGVSVVTLSRAERGIIDPRTMKEMN